MKDCRNQSSGRWERSIGCSRNSPCRGLSGRSCHLNLAITFFLFPPSFARDSFLPNAAFVAITRPLQSASCVYAICNCPVFHMPNDITHSVEGTFRLAPSLLSIFRTSIHRHRDVLQSAMLQHCTAIQLMQAMHRNTTDTTNSPV